MLAGKYPIEPSEEKFRGNERFLILPHSPSSFEIKIYYQNEPIIHGLQKRGGSVTIFYHYTIIIYKIN